MQTYFIEQEIKYIGSQLSPHWICKNFKIPIKKTNLAINRIAQIYVRQEYEKYEYKI